MTPTHRAFSLGVLLLACPLQSAPEGTNSARSSGWSPPETLEELPLIEALPDLLTFADGSRVETAEDWSRRRAELKAMLLWYQYGSLPRRPDRVVAVETKQEPHASGLGTLEHVTLEIDSGRKLRFRAVLYLPKHEGRRPVIIREEGRLGRRREAPMFLEKGYVFIEYARHDLDPDRDRVVGPAQAAYPEHDWATLAVWAWCGMRLVDWLETRDDVDMERIGITGHSRGGKMALLAAALDERFAFAVPHQSGAGGAGCYRLLGPGAETLAQNDKPHWYHERIRWFSEKEERLPIDQHFLKALMAPRALLVTEAIDDEFANPLGSLATTLAAQEIYELLGAPERNGISFRRGGHSTQVEDWERLLEFAEWHFFGKRPANTESYWSTPFPVPPGYPERLPKRELHSWEDWGVEVTPAEKPDGGSNLLTVEASGRADRDHHGQGRYGAVEAGFAIGRHQVSQVEYAAFLNAVARSDPAGLWNAAMATGDGAIRRIEIDSGARYEPVDAANPVPVTHVSWLDAVRYCNWIHNGRPQGEQGPETTENGAYSLLVARETGRGVTRKPGAKCFLPTEDEWYRAAYYRPGDEGKGVWLHFAPLISSRPMVSESRPEAVSPLGLAGFADKVWEWTETPVGTLHRGIRSGAWFLGNNRQSAGRFYSNPRIECRTIGFRIAMPAEDSSP